MPSSPPDTSFFSQNEYSLRTGSAGFRRSFYYPYPRKCLKVAVFEAKETAPSWGPDQ